MKILMTGITSMHGWPLYIRLKKEYPDSFYGTFPCKMTKFFPTADNLFACNIEDHLSLKRIFSLVKPDIIVHAGGVCDLDLCEAKPDFAYLINVVGTRNVVALAHNIPIIYISSDLVFSGEKNVSGYTEEALPDPISVVGKTYLQAEKEIIKAPHHSIIRIGLPIGDSLSGTKGAVDFIKKRLQNKKPMTLFYDELRSLIHTDCLAQGLTHFLKQRIPGLFHFGGKKKWSLYDIGAQLVTMHQYDTKNLIRASRHDDIGGPPRIGDVSLDSSKFYTSTGFVPQLVWEQTSQ